MALSTAAKVAMCVCPPAMMAGTVATVPPVKRAVHHLTAHHAPRPHRKLATAAKPVPRPVDCAPAAAAALPPAPIVTYAAPIPAEPAGDAGGPGSGGGVGGIGVGAAPAVAGIPVATTPDTTPTPTPTTPVGSVPEPASWAMLIGGIGMAGAALRRRRRAATAKGIKLANGAGVLLWPGAAAAEMGDTAMAAALHAATGTAGKTGAAAAGKAGAAAAGKGALASVAGKAALCVCPAAVVAGSVMAVPPLRQAVHAATAPARPLAAAPIPAPCPDGTVPVSAAALKGFPATVATVAKKS